MRTHSSLTLPLSPYSSETGGILSMPQKRDFSMQMPQFQKPAPGQALKEYSTDLTQMALEGKLEYELRSI